jgi:hypothetical protein
VSRITGERRTACRGQLRRVLGAAKTLSRKGVFPLDDWNDVIAVNLTGVQRRALRRARVSDNVPASHRRARRDVKRLRRRVGG